MTARNRLDGKVGSITGADVGMGMGMGMGTGRGRPQRK